MCNAILRTSLMMMLLASGCCRDIHGLQVCLASISAAWKSTTWVWGLAPKSYSKVSLTPNCAAMFYMVVLGEVDLWMVAVEDMVRVRKAQKKPHDKLDIIKKDLEAMTDPEMEELARQLSMYHIHVPKETLIYVPAGHIVMEKAGESSLVYGLRKSVFFDTVRTKELYTAAVDVQAELTSASQAKYKAVKELFT